MATPSSASVPPLPSVVVESRPYKAIVAAVGVAVTILTALLPSLEDQPWVPIVLGVLTTVGVWLQRNPVTAVQRGGRNV